MKFPCAEGDPYYPIPHPENLSLFRRYEELARIEAGTTFVGRLATYRYYNMDQIVGQALATYRRRFAELQLPAVQQTSTAAVANSSLASAA